MWMKQGPTDSSSPASQIECRSQTTVDLLRNRFVLVQYCSVNEARSNENSDLDQLPMGKIVMGSFQSLGNSGPDVAKGLLLLDLDFPSPNEPN